MERERKSELLLRNAALARIFASTFSVKVTLTLTRKLPRRALDEEVTPVNSQSSVRNAHQWSCCAASSCFFHLGSSLANNDHNTELRAALSLITLCPSYLHQAVVMFNNGMFTQGLNGLSRLFNRQGSSRSRRAGLLLSPDRRARIDENSLNTDRPSPFTSLLSSTDTNNWFSLPLHDGPGNLSSERNETQTLSRFRRREQSICSKLCDRWRNEWRRLSGQRQSERLTEL